MGWMGGGGVKAPSTSGQEAELRRQTDMLMAQFQQFMTAQTQQAGDERNADQTRYDAQRAADLAESQRQQTALKALLDQQGASQAQINAALKEQADNAQAVDNQRATNARDYSTGRSDLIDQVTAGINGAFGGFDDNYYKDYADKVVDANRPDADQQYQQQRRGSRLALSDVGNLNSSAAARAMGILKTGYQTKLGQIASGASDAATQLRDRIDGQKRSALAGLVNSAFVGDPNLSGYETDVGGQLNTIASRLNGYLNNVTQQVKLYAPVAGGGTAPQITAPQVSSPLLAPLTGGTSGGGNLTNNQNPKPLEVV